jgi:hypothetical protein
LASENLWISGSTTTRASISLLHQIMTDSAVSFRWLGFNLSMSLWVYNWIPPYRKFLMVKCIGCEIVLSSLDFVFLVLRQYYWLNNG